MHIHSQYTVSLEIRRQSECVLYSEEPQIKHLSSMIDHSDECRLGRCTFPRNFRLGGVFRIFYS